MSPASVLIALKLRGFASLATLETMLGEPVIDTVAALQAEGQVSEAKLGLRLTSSGQGAAIASWQAMRERIDTASIAALYADFHVPNAAFKITISDWQLRGGVINDHQDAAYDAAVILRLVAIDDEVGHIIVRAAAMEPRLARYASRLGMALAAVRAGNIRFVAGPLIDSYHTVWFELHEELIRLAGLSRATEAAEGRA